MAPISLVTAPETPAVVRGPLRTTCCKSLPNPLSQTDTHSLKLYFCVFVAMTVHTVGRTTFSATTVPMAC